MSKKLRDRVHLTLIALISLFSTFAANRAAGYLLPEIHGLGPSCVFAATVAIALYLSSRPARPFGLWVDNADWARVARISLIWLSAWFGSRIVYATISGHWNPYVTGLGPVIGFLLFGPLAEELLFRGAAYELAQRAYPNARSAPAVLSTVLFSAYHLQIHGYQLSPMVVAQMAFVIPLGLVLARIRALTGSIWPGLMLHIITNIPDTFGPY